MLNAERIDMMFQQAAALHADGKADDAVAILAEIVSGSAVFETRKRASALFGQYVQHVDRSSHPKTPDDIPLEVSVPIAPVAHHNHERSFNGVSSVTSRPIRTQVRSAPLPPKKPVSPRIVTIASATQLPSPLCDNIIAGLRISNGNKFEMPKSFIPVVQEIERLTATFERRTTQQTMVQFLETALGFFPNTPEKPLVFIAIVNIFYANDYIDAMQAKELSFLAPGEGSTKTVREILSDVE